MTEPELRLRRDALGIFQAALAAVDPEKLVREALEKNAALDLPAGGRLLLVAVGKAAVSMARGATAVLGDRVGEGVVLAPSGTKPVPLVGTSSSRERLRFHFGGHPLPDQAGVDGARDIAMLAQRAGPLDRIILLLSGGGSALLTLPHADVSLDELRRVTDLLLRAGATIQELNTVRKHLETLKGGRLAGLAVPAQLMALILSDVVGDPLDVIASGPVSPNRSTFGDAIHVLEGRGIWKDAPVAVRDHLIKGYAGHIADTPKVGDAAFAGVHVTVVGNAELAARSASAEAARLGYDSRVISAQVTGEAREVGASLADSVRELLGSARRPACRVSAGETTVTVRGDGRGGRNQEVALAAAPVLDGAGDVLVLSAGTDGLDGPTDAAGALATGTTIGRAHAVGMEPGAYLERNDSYAFFQALDDLVITGPTGTNVADVMLVMAR